jgi:hypothetical protein
VFVQAETRSAIGRMGKAVRLPAENSATSKSSLLQHTRDRADQATKVHFSALARPH